MIHLTSVWILTRQLHTGLGVVLIQRPLITVDGLTEGNCSDLSAQFSEGGPPWPPEGENYNMLWTICTYKTGTLYIFHLSVSYIITERSGNCCCWERNRIHTEVRRQNLEDFGLKMRSTDLEQDHRIGVKENSAKYQQMIISYGISKQKSAHLRHDIYQSDKNWINGIFDLRSKYSISVTRKVLWITHACVEVA